MTQEQIKSKLIDLYESNKDNILDKIETIFKTNLEVESIFNEFIWLDYHEIEQIYNYIWDNLEDYIIDNLDLKLVTDNILCNYEYSDEIKIPKIIMIQIIFSDKFVKFIKEILNERNLDYELRNFGY